MASMPTQGKSSSWEVISIFTTPSTTSPPPTGAPKSWPKIEEEEACAGIDAARAPTAEVIEAIPEDTPEGQDDESAAVADWQPLSTATTVSTSTVVVNPEDYD